MGLYDLPAFVDFILHRTGFMKMTLLGHSFSNAITMIMTSLRPEYNEKINLFVGMAPFVFASHLRQGPLLEFLIKSVSVSYLHILPTNEKIINNYYLWL